VNQRTTLTVEASPSSTNGAPWACDACGAAFGPTRLPVARLGHNGARHLLACMDCAPSTCPMWCDARHNAVEVEHVSEQHAHETPRGDVAVQLRQEPGGRPRIALATFRHDSEELGEAELSLADVEILAKTLLARVRAARSS
jgi:hypothetical protein